MPTDTVYGLAAALDSASGVARLYEVKGRPRSQPCQVLIYSNELRERTLRDLDPAIASAARAVLPGPVTCLVPDEAGRFAAASGEAVGTVGVRAPRVGARLAALDLPLVATSANHPGGTDPVRLEEVPADLRAAAGAQLDGGALPGVASWVLDLREVPTAGIARAVREGRDRAGVARALAAGGVRLEGVAG